MTDDHNDQSSANTGAPAKPEEKKKENPRRKIILTGVIAVLAVGAGVYWFMTRN